MPMLDLTNQPFGSLTAIKVHHTSHQGAYWLCRCKCGKEKVVRSYDLRSNPGISCGCDRDARRSATCRGLKVSDGVKKTCSRCRKRKLMEEFWVDQDRYDGRKNSCIECEKVAGDRLDAAREAKGLPKRSTEFARKSKIIVLQHYSGGKMKCDCCDESLIEFLTIDHIDGGGTKHRVKVGHGNMYRWLIRNKFPDGYRVLCMNCNFSYGKYGYCPHKGIPKGEVRCRGLLRKPVLSR